MGLFSKLFGKGKNKENENSKSKEIFYAQQDKLMQEATENAQKNFKYFWRELYWEYRRIIPALNFAMVKIPFEQQFDGHDQPIVEHMWINEINFDGHKITGALVNKPNQLTNVSVGDKVMKDLSDISDWMFASGGKVYGGFTVQVMRSGMSSKERTSHDQAWGLDFGDHNETLLVFEQKENPENLIEHPMSKNMSEKLREFLQENPDEMSNADENGHIMLHNEAIAGNKSSIEILLEFGADKTIKSNSGQTALDYAKSMGWEHLLEILK